MERTSSTSKGVGCLTRGIFFFGGGADAAAAVDEVEKLKFEERGEETLEELKLVERGEDK